MRRDYAKLVTRITSAGVSSLMQAGTLLLVARLVGPPAFGAFGQLTSTGYILGALFGFGLSVRALRLVRESNWRGIATTMIILRATTSAVIAGLLYATFSFSTPAIGALAAGAIFIANELLAELIQGLLAGQGRQNSASLLLVVQRVPPLAGVALQPLSSLGVWGNLVVGILLALSLQIVVAAPMFARPVHPGGLLKSATGYWSSTLASNLGQLDVTVVRFAAGASTAGTYVAGSRIGTPLNLVTNAMLNVFVPSMTAEDDPEKRASIFRRVRLLAVIYGAMLLVGSPAIASALVWILGPAYSSGWLLYASVVAGSALSGVSQSYQAFVYAEGRPFRAAFAVLVGTLCGLLALLIGSLVWGIAGAALGPIVGQAVILMCFMFDRYTEDRRFRP